MTGELEGAPRMPSASRSSCGCGTHREGRLTEEPRGPTALAYRARTHDELEPLIGDPPRVASPAFLDAVGSAARALEEASC